MGVTVGEEGTFDQATMKRRFWIYSSAGVLVMGSVCGGLIKMIYDNMQYSDKHKNDAVKVYTLKDNSYRMVDARYSDKPDTIDFQVAKNASDTVRMIMENKTFG